MVQGQLRVSEGWLTEGAPPQSSALASWEEEGEFLGTAGSSTTMGFERGSALHKGERNTMLTCFLAWKRMNT